ncbi:MAG TPA: MerR family transcriptional regulator [Chloroflexota bacterium]|nr:MerR family transcriptional regulator [Chloroflexota bacterium]
MISEQDAVFIISVAARLVEMHPSTLRKYERCGLLEPGRLSGRLRLYSEDDIARLRQIKGLVEERGINLAGVELILALTDRIEQLRRIVEEEPDSDRVRLAAKILADTMLAKLGRPAPGSDRLSSPTATASSGVGSD